MEGEKRPVKIPELLPDPNGNAEASVLEEESEGPKRRPVFVVTVPVKDIGPARKAVIRLVSWVVGSPLTWAMHWAIRIDDTYFELQRPRGLGKPYLAVRTWPEERRKEIITDCPMGSTLLTNEEIIAASSNSTFFTACWSVGRLSRYIKIGQAYFTENNLYYDLYLNNCQLFVTFSMKRIAPAESESLATTTSSFGNTIGVILSFATHLISLPFVTAYLRWLRWRGCDQHNLQVYAALFSMCVGMTGSATLSVSSQCYNLLATVIHSEKNLFVAILGSLQTAPFVVTMFISMPILTIPRVKQRRDGTWLVSALMMQNNEEAVDSEVAIRRGIPLLAALLGGCMGLALWIYILVPLLTVRCFKALKERISFRSPGQLVKSVWGVLMMPLFDLDADHVKADDPSATEIPDQGAQGDPI